MNPMDRRQFLAFLAAGAVITAEGLWMPGKKLISIPKLVVAEKVTPSTYRIQPSRHDPSYAQVVAGMRRDRGFVLSLRERELLGLARQGIRL